MRHEDPTPAFRNIVDPELAAEYRRAGWWGDVTLGEVVAGWAAARPDRLAFISDHGSMTWQQYSTEADRLAEVMVEIGLMPGDRVAVWLPDSASVHVAFIAAERAGVTVVGIGARGTPQEVSHLMGRTKASAVITLSEHRGEATSHIVANFRESGRELEHHFVVPRFEAEPGGSITVDGSVVNGIEFDGESRRMRADDLFLINSTSGTTGLPKCVMHFQNRWMYFHQKAAENAAFTDHEVFAGAVPAPFGFGLWTSHFTPTLMGAPIVVSERFDAGKLIKSIEEYRVTVLSCVSTQFVMMLNHPSFATADLSSLRAMFTGGEAIPYERAGAFEDQTGCAVLQFFGSNETGLLSGTSLQDRRSVRFGTAGRIVPEMNVRLFDDGVDVTDRGRGQPGCRGPATSTGYLDDPEANAKLFTADGWMLMGDICTLDDEGFLAVVGRLSDIIIRGGKNISAAQVEDEVSSHPAVAIAAAVPVADPVFGEKVCVLVEVHDGEDLALDGLLAYLDERGTPKEVRPEYLLVLDELPRSSGGKVAKGQLKEMAAREFG